MHPRFYLTFVSWGSWASWTDHKAIVLGHTTISLAQDRIVQRGYQDGCFEIIRHHSLDDSTKALEGVAVTGDPRADLLVKDQLRVLVPAEAKGHYKGVGGARPALSGVK